MTFLMSVSNLSAQSWTDWSRWTDSGCYKGIDFRVKSKKTSTGKYEMYLEFKNRYYKNVSFNYEIKGGSYTVRNKRVTVKAGDTYKTWGGSNFTDDYFTVSTFRLSFKGDPYKYVNCDD